MLIGIQDEILKIHSLGLLDLLLEDKTSKRKILWATDAYSSLGDKYNRDKEITSDLITGICHTIIRNRANKDLEEQSERTKQHAEVFTPFWICKMMNNYADMEWLNCRSYYIDENNFTNICDYIEIKDIEAYVFSRRMELTCGEGPFLVSAYDMGSGTVISLNDRAGIIDRKLQVISKFVDDVSEWLDMAYKALESTYGYEFQGDNLLIARVNVLMSFEEYFENKFHRAPTKPEYQKAANIIAWNIWQMDGLTGLIPYCRDEEYQPTFEDLLFGPQGDDKDYTQPEMTACRIYDWRSHDCTIEYRNMSGRKNKMFDFIIGNPPYNDDTINTSDNPIYHSFMLQAYKLANRVELITPARFLFGAGKTPKDFTTQMLNDVHFKVLSYWANSSDVFTDVDLKGGVAISYRDATSNFGSIVTFTPFKELHSVERKVAEYDGFSPLCDIIYVQLKFNLDKLYADYPEYITLVGSNGTERRLTTSIFEQLDIFTQDRISNSQIKVLGLIKLDRVYRYVEAKYLAPHPNLEKWKVFVPKSNGSGALGETLSTPLIGAPLIGATQSFISIGKFETEDEAKACLKYVKSKFARAMLGILKVTQDNPPEKWKYVPLQNFTSSSDIDWSKSVREIDQQLYKKYNLSEDEIAFIEKNVQEME